MSQSKKGNRYQISFKENIQELEIMNYMLEKSNGDKHIYKDAYIRRYEKK